MLDRSQAPEVRPFGHLTLPPEEVVTLSNGVVLHTFYGGDQDVVRLDLSAEGGAADSFNPCVPSFAAEMLREGTAHHDSDTIADIVDFNGAWFNSGAVSHYTSLRVSSLTSKLFTLAPLLVESFVEPSFPAKSFEIIRAKGVARQRLNLSRVSFLAMADNRRLIAGDGHPDSLVPSPESIEALTLDNLKDFHRSTLDARRTHAYLCGHFSTEDTDRLARLLETIPVSDIPSPLNIRSYIAAEPQTSVIDKPGSLQSAVVLSIPAVPRSHPDYNPLRMAVTALGGYFGSRLMMNIREDKGYTYGISASLSGAQEGSYISISAQCDNAYTEALVEEVRSELRRMVTDPLTPDEMSKLKFNVASELASTIDSPMTIMDYYQLQRTVGIPADYFDSRQETLANITPEIICELSARYLDPDRLRISIAGDLKR